jgi:NAD(P)-dependent dehydrogenase (short-subunit alcohol dehydrogenase family)
MASDTAGRTRRDAKARYDGSVVVVTGAANGIGRAYAAGFAREGAAVALADIDEPGVERAAEELRATGATAVGIAVDVSDESSVAALMQRVVTDLGGIDVVVNNAGLHLGRFNETTTLPVDQWRRILDVNVIGAMLCAREARVSMAARGGGVVLNQSSMAAYLAAGGAYGVSKVALNGLTISLAAELAPDGTRVVGIAPGMVGSDAVLAHLAPEHKDLVIRMQRAPLLATAANW